MTPHERDDYWMGRALAQAARGRGTARPNPMVGCVLVRDDELVAEGYHERAGGPHAEVVALRAAGEAARGCTLYVNLEPCAHFGRTPPCADAVIAAGVSRVVAAMIDPNPRVSGVGLDRIRAAGIETTVGVREAEARRLNEGFVSVMTRGRPFVTLKLAASLDGRTASRDGISQSITSEPARRQVHQWRAEHDAILVGAETLRRDDPTLTARDVPVTVQPHRVVLDTHLRAPLTHRVFDTAVAPTTVCCGPGADAATRLALQARGVRVVEVPPGAGGLDVTAVLREVLAQGSLSVLCEGGSALAGSLVDAGCVDRLHLFLAPLLLGGASAPGVLAGLGAHAPADATRVQRWQHELVGPDLLITADLALPDRALPDREALGLPPATPR